MWAIKRRSVSCLCEVPWNVRRIGELKSEVRECMKKMIWSELVARTEIENMEWFGCEKEKKEGTGIDVRRWNAEVEMGYKGILPREAVKELKKSEKWRSTYKDIKKCITEFCREVWKERNEIWVEERWRQRREGKETIERSESDVVGKLESQIEDGQVNEEGYKENKNEQVEEKTDQEEGQWDGGTSSVDQTEMNWDWEVSNQQHKIERWYRQVHGWDEIQAESVPQSTLEGEEWLEEDEGEHKLQRLVRMDDGRWEGRQKKLDEYWKGEQEQNQGKTMHIQVRVNEEDEEGSNRRSVTDESEQWNWVAEEETEMMDKEEVLVSRENNRERIISSNIETEIPGAEEKCPEYDSEFRGESCEYGVSTPRAQTSKKRMPKKVTKNCQNSHALYYREKHLGKRFDENSLNDDKCDSTAIDKEESERKSLESKYEEARAKQQEDEKKEREEDSRREVMEAEEKIRREEEERQKWDKWEEEEREESQRRRELVAARRNSQELERTQKKRVVEERREEIRSRIKQLGLRMGRKKQIIENNKKGTKRKKEDMDKSRKKRKIEVGRGIKRKWEEITGDEGEEIRIVKLRRKEVTIQDR